MRKISKKNIIFYLGSIALALFYVLILGLGMKPKVGVEYKMYYITHELSDWPGYNKLMYTPGTVEYCTEQKDRDGNLLNQVCRRKGQGFKEEQYEGSVNSGDTAYIYYMLKDTLSDSEYVFELNDFSGSGCVEVYCNDTKIGEVSEAGTYRFAAGSLLPNEVITIRFEAKNCSYRLWSTALTS